MQAADLAQMLELMAQALRLLPAGAAPAGLPAVLQPAAPARTLNDWLAIYTQELQTRNYKPQTLRNRISNLEHIRRMWGARPIAEIKPMDIKQALVAGFLPKRPSTALRVLHSLREAYAEAIVNDWVVNNPAAAVKLPSHRVQRQRLAFETWQQMRTLSQAGPQRWVESMLLLALVTGQRRADLGKMTFNDVVDGHLRIEQQKEAGKGYGARVEIPLALRLDAINMTLGDVIEHCRNSAKPGPHLLRKAGGGAIEVSSLSARFGECLSAVLGDKDPGGRVRPSLHEVRSLSARLYRQQGLDVQTLLGHADAEMTELYINDRGLTAKEYKRVKLPTASEPAAA